MPAFSIRPRERGQGLMEFALVLPILLLLFMGIFDFGRMIYLYAQLSNGAREAARYGSVTGVGSGAQSSPQYLDCTGIRSAAVRGYGLPMSPDQVLIQYDDGLTLYGFTCDQRPSPDAVAMGDRVRITVTDQFSFITPVLSALPPVTVSLTSARTVLRGGTLVPPGSN